MTLCSQALCLTAHPLFMTLIKSNPLGKHSPQTILLSDARFLRYREKTFVPNGTLFHPRESQKCAVRHRAWKKVWPKFFFWKNHQVKDVSGQFRPGEQESALTLSLTHL